MGVVPNTCAWEQFLLLLLLLLSFGVRCARPGESENTLSVQRPQPHTTNPWKEEEEYKIVETKKKEQIMPTGKHWLCS